MRFSVYALLLSAALAPFSPLAHADTVSGGGGGGGNVGYSEFSGVWHL